MQTIRGTNVSIRDLNASYWVTQGGSFNYLDANYNNSDAFQSGIYNTAYVSGWNDYLSQTVTYDGYGQNWASMNGASMSINTVGPSTVYSYGDGATGYFNGPATTLAATGNGTSWTSYGQLTADITGNSAYVESYGPTDLQLQGNYADVFVNSTNGVGDTVSLTETGYSDWTHWTGDAGGKGDGAPDRLNFTAGPGSADTRLWASGGNVTALLTDGSQTIIDAQDATSLNVVTFGRADFQINAGDTPVNVWTLEDLIPTYYGGSKGLVSDSPVAVTNFAGAGTSQIYSLAEMPSFAGHVSEGGYSF